VILHELLEALEECYIANRKLHTEPTSIARGLREVAVALQEPEEVGVLGAREIEKAHIVNITTRCDSYR
jgi:hypothetical protein